MLTEQQYATVVFTASRANAVLTQTIRNKEALGCYPKWGTASCQSLKIKSGYFSLDVQDYSSVASVDIYNQLLDIGSTWTGGIVFDPNYQNPTSPIVIVQGGAFGYVKSPNIPFNTNHVILNNWQTVYAPLYGQNPTIEIFTDQGGVDQKDTQSAPIYNYATPGDESTLLQSIEWTYPFTTLGYYTISGVVPGATAGGGTGSGSALFIFVLSTNPNISYDGDGNFVYTDPRLVGKSGYFIMATQLGSDLFDGSDFFSNPASGSFTIVNPSAFVLEDSSRLVILVQ